MIVRRIWLCLAHSLICTITFAQISRIDSLKKNLPALKDTARVDCFNQLSHEYMELEKKDSAEYYITQAYAEAIQSNYIHGVAIALCRRSQMVRHFYNDFVRAEALGKESLNWYERTGKIRILFLTP